MSDSAIERTHVLGELGLTLRADGDELIGHVDVSPHMYSPGTDCLRASVMLVWADTMTGLLSTAVVAPRVPVTLDLAVELFRLPRATAEITGSARLVKAGRTTVVVAAEFAADGVPTAIATGTFMPTPDPQYSVPTLDEMVLMHAEVRAQLTQPFAERAGCVRERPGVASLARRSDGLNATNTINGGLLALVVEEAALSLTPQSTLTSLSIKYLRAARVGPVVATADPHGDVARVEVVDTGNDDRLVITATTRSAVVQQ